MNRDEAVKKIAKSGNLSVTHAEYLYDSIIPKPVVPKYVADWVYKSRKYDYDFDQWFDFINQSHDVYEWLNCKNKRQAELNALALVTLIVNGPNAVVVDKETRYTVRFKGLVGFSEYLTKYLRNKEWFFASNEKRKNFRITHTRKELEEAGFGWVFDCEGVEVKEVTG